MATPEIPTIEPREFAIGETLVWRSSFPDYSPAEGWALTYYFRGPTKFDVVAATDDENPDGFKSTLPATESEKCIAGTYFWQAWVSKDADKYRLASGETVAVPGLPTEDAKFDGRIVAKRILDAIDAVMEGKATKDQQQYTIAAGGAQQQLIRIPIPELLELRKYYAAIVRRHNRKGKSFRTIKIQFDDPS